MSAREYYKYITILLNLPVFEVQNPKLPYYNIPKQKQFEAQNHDFE